jgi:hypothetical protein
MRAAVVVFPGTAIATRSACRLGTRRSHLAHYA